MYLWSSAEPVGGWLIQDGSRGGSVSLLRWGPHPSADGLAADHAAYTPAAMQGPRLLLGSVSPESSIGSSASGQEKRTEKGHGQSGGMRLGAKAGSGMNHFLCHSPG